MKIVFLVLSILVAIVVILLIVAIFFKKDYLVVRKIIINRPKQEVFDYIKYLKNQAEWSKWETMDPNMKTSYSGTDGTVGFVYGWESKNRKVGTGTQEVRKIIDGERIDWDYLFVGYPPTQCYWATEAVSENVTQMEWGFEGRMKYPMNLMILFFDKMVGNDLDKELVSLKTKIESKKQ